ncbi:BLUF domain-containing protein, partial [Oceanospirillaceae bacterium]|nr:BLUF domain-containing protein [Oceanospirillaceae bacterium]
MVKRQKLKLKQIIYTSKPVALEDNTIDEILASSHKYNSKSGVTGLLIFGVELYMQFLEGPVQELDETFNRIKRDNRHADKITLFCGEFI